jgi:hypothetical protein
LKIKSGVIVESQVSFSADAVTAEAQMANINEEILDQPLSTLGDWRKRLGSHGSLEEFEAVGNWLNETLPSPQFLEEKFQVSTAYKDSTSQRREIGYR